MEIMKMKYIIYTSGMVRGSWRWQWPTQVNVLYGPPEELARVKTLNSVGSRFCPHVKAEYMGWGDSRYDGPRSRYGQALAEANDWAEKRGLEPFAGEEYLAAVAEAYLHA